MHILYTTHCPRCEVLKKKLEQSNISFIEETDLNKMLNLNIKAAPMLQLEETNTLLDFSAAIKWLKDLEVK